MQHVHTLGGGGDTKPGNGYQQLKHLMTHVTTYLGAPPNHVSSGLSTHPTTELACELSMPTSYFDMYVCAHVLISRLCRVKVFSTTTSKISDRTERAKQRCEVW